MVDYNDIIAIGKRTFYFEYSFRSKYTEVFNTEKGSHCVIPLAIAKEEW